MALNIWALSIVKATGAEFGAVQLVFLRAVTGLALMLPWIWMARARFAEVRAPGLHLMRIALSTVTLACSFHAIARLPLALVTAVNFTRPLILIAMAALFLSEPATPRRWIAAGIGLLGVFVAVEPGRTAPDWAILSLVVMVLAGTAAIVATRKLNDQPEVVMMAAYTAGLALCTAPFALASWTPIPAGLWPLLLGIGLFAQLAQFCFLRAHRLAEAGMLAIIGYASLILGTGTGWLVFDEVPGAGFWGGATLIVVASLIARRPAADRAGARGARRN